MIKKKLFKYTSVLLCASMMAMSLTACQANSVNRTSDNAVEISQQDDNSSLEKILSDTLYQSTNTSSAKEDSKEETVYVFADATGKQDKLIVNEKLKNASKASTISDVTNLKDIKNINGDEAFQTSGSQVTWSADGKNITYQGTSNEAVPVTMKITYYLNDKEISANELAGKSGKVKIRFDYTNNLKKQIVVNGKTKDAYVPFTMITGMILSPDKFSNIEVTNGKMIESDKGNIVVGVTMPGLKESLDLSFDGKAVDMDIPQYFEVTADVNDFEIDMTMSVATSNALTTANLDELNTNKITDKVDELSDAGNQLEDGTNKLADGVSALNDKVPELKNGVTQLDDGAGTLQGGAAQLDDGAGALQSGMIQLDSGVDSLKDGAVQIDDGMSTLKDGAAQLDNGVDSLKDGTVQLDSGVDSLKDGAVQLDNGMSTLQDGTEQLHEGSKTLQSGINEYTAGVSVASDGSIQVDEGSSQLLAGINAYSESMRTQIVTGIAQLSLGAGNLSVGIDTLGTMMTESFAQIKQNAQTYGAKYNEAITQASSIETLATTNMGAGSVNDNLKNIAQGIKAASGKDVEFADITPATDLKGNLTDTQYVSQLVSKYMNSYAAAVGYNDVLGELNIAVANASQGVVTSIGDIYMKEMLLLVNAVGNGSVATALNQVYSSAENENVSLSQSLKQLSDGGKEVSNGAQKLQAGIGTFEGLTEETVKEMQNDTLCSALFKLQAGAKQLSGGTIQLQSGLSQLKANNDKLNKGAADLQTGSSQLVTGANDLKNGTVKLAAGANDLKNGTVKLVTGANDLKDGTVKLATGSNDLKNGTLQLTSGANNLKRGTIQLLNGTKDLKDGTFQLLAGTKDLKNGTSQLLEASDTLADGVGQLHEGSITLKDGMIEFNTTGLSKISNLINNDMNEAVEMIKKVVELGNDYQSFAGKTQDVKGSVKFIYKTEGITK